MVSRAGHHIPAGGRELAARSRSAPARLSLAGLLPAGLLPARPASVAAARPGLPACPAARSAAAMAFSFAVGGSGVRARTANRELGQAPDRSPDSGNRRALRHPLGFGSICAFSLSPHTTTVAGPATSGANSNIQTVSLTQSQVIVRGGAGREPFSGHDLHFRNNRPRPSVDTVQRAPARASSSERTGSS